MLRCCRDGGMIVEPFLALLAAMFLCAVLLALVGSAPFTFLPIMMIASDSPRLTKANSYEILFALMVGPWIILLFFAILSIWLFIKGKPKIGTLMSAIPLFLVLALLRFMRLI